MTATVPKRPDQEQQLLDAKQVGELAKCSPRHLHRLADSGRMPEPIRLGTLVRWPKHVIDAWIGAGCPPVSSESDIEVRP